jgi:hypothetical protein
MSGRKMSARVKRKIAQWYADREAGAAAAEVEAQLAKRTKCRLRLWEEMTRPPMACRMSSM